MYKLFLDRPEIFECEVAVKNATLKNSIARLVVEAADGLNFVFNGKIENEKCIIPIRRLKGLLEENSKGNVHLEIIVEDTFFQPWHDDFIVEEHTSVKVKVNEAKISNKPIVEVKVPSNEKQSVIASSTIKHLPKKINNINILLPINEITSICAKFGITKPNLRNKRSDFLQILTEYFKANPEFICHKSIILEGLGRSIK